MTSWVKTNARPGDTLGSLARRYGVTPRAILRMNGVTPKEDHSAKYVAQRAKDLALPATMPTAAAQKVIEESDISVWVNDADGRAVEIHPGSMADIARFATCPTGAYAIFAADSVIYLPEFTALPQSLPLVNIKPKAPATPTTPPGLSGPLTHLARLDRRAYMGEYTLGTVLPNARNYDTTVLGDVIEIQTELNDSWGASKVHFTAGPGPSLGLAVDGIYGPNTRQAVQMFQGANGLSATGNMDSATSQKLQDDAANEIGATLVTAPGGSGMLLLGLGFFAVVGVGAVIYTQRNKKGRRRARRNPHRRRRLRSA